MTTRVQSVTASFAIDGLVWSPDRAGLRGLLVQVVDKTVGADRPLAVAPTDDHGRYQAAIPRALLKRLGKDQPDLQARVVSGHWSSPPPRSITTRPAA